MECKVRFASPALLAAASWIVIVSASPTEAQFLPPNFGWDYAYEAAAGEGAAGTGAAFDALDGTWSHMNGSDEWDGSEIGSGRPGGASVVDDSYLRLQDTGDPRDYAFGDPGSNRKLYLGHDVGADGASATMLDEGVTLNFRVRVSTPAVGGPLDDVHVDGGGGIVPFPAGGDGYLIHDGGKGAISIKQASGGVISFSPTLASDTGAAFEGILMNNLNGAAISGDVDSGEGGTLNGVALDPTAWTDVWVNIVAGGAGTHSVTIYLNGATDPVATFEVTAGTGSDFADISYIAIGQGSTGQSGAIDIDFVRFKSGVHPPSANNDLCEDALAVSVPSVTSASTLTATVEDPPIATCVTSITAPGVWFKVLGTGTVMTAATCSENTDFDTKLGVFTDGCETLTCVAGNDDGAGCTDFQSSVNFPSEAGREYLILVHAFQAQTGNFDLTVTAAPPPPPEDLCDGAIVVDLDAANPAVFTGTTAGLTTDPENDTCGDSNAPGAWYSVVGTGGAMRASTCSESTTYDTRLSVFSGECGALECVGENDDDDACTFSTLRSTLAWDSVAGVTYFVLVHGFSTSSGDYELSISGEPPPACLTTISACRADQSSKEVSLAFATTATEHSAIEISLNGAVVASLDAAATSFTHAPDLVAGCLNALEYSVNPVGIEDCSASCRVVLSPGSVVLAEDFEGYADDTALEVDGGWFIIDENTPAEDATWTLSNPGGRANPPTFDGRASTGAFAISDSDAAGGSNPVSSGMSHDLWSPSFSLAGLDAAWLHLDVSAQLNNNGEAIFDIDVSLDAGQNWTNVFRRVAPGRTAAPLADATNADGYFGRLDVDLSDAVGQTDVRFRLRHFEPSDDWWIAVDNVLVDDVAPKSGGPDCLLGPETFDDGIPAGWTVVDLDGDGSTWTTADPCGRAAGLGNFDGRGVNRLSGGFAIMDSDCDPDPVEDEYLVTPAVDCSNLLDVYLHFSSETVVDASALQDVLLSLDGGATFEPVPVFSYQAGGLFDGGEEPFYAQRVLRVDAAIGEPSVAFAFRYSSPGDRWWWAIDDVKVSGTADVPPGIGPFIRGDCNQDRQTGGVTDAVFNLNWLFLGGTAPGCRAACDTNGDGATAGVTDAVYGLSFNFLGGPMPPAPFPACGTSERASDLALGCDVPTVCP